MTDDAVKNKNTGQRSLLAPSVRHRAQRGYPWKLNTPLAMALAGGSLGVWAQETNQIEQLQRQMEQMQANFDRVARE